MRQFTSHTEAKCQRSGWHFFCQGLGNRSIEIPCTWQLKHLGQLKEQAEFVVSRSMTLPSAPPWAGGAIWWSIPAPQKQNKKRVTHTIHFKLYFNQDNYALLDKFRLDLCPFEEYSSVWVEPQYARDGWSMWYVDCYCFAFYGRLFGFVASSYLS